MRCFASMIAALVLLAHALSPATDALAASSRNVALVNTVALSGNGQVIISGGYGYAPANDGLHIYDWADATRPREVGFAALPNLAFRVAVAGSVAYVADNRADLHVVDVAAPAAPRALAKLPIGSSYDPSVLSAVTTSMVVARNVLYLGIGEQVDLLGRSGGLVVVDISKPQAPRRALDISGFTPYAMVARGNYLYVIGDEWLGSSGVRRSGLRTFDITQPDNPRQVGFLQITKAFHDYGIDVALDSDALFVVSGFFFMAFDLALPTAPRQVAEYTAENGVLDVLVRGHYAFLTVDVRDTSAKGASLRVLDIANPAQPIEVGFYTVREGDALLAASNNLAYLQCAECGGTLVLAYTGTSTVKGQVIDAQGRPVPGAQIASSAGKGATSAADGTFALADLGNATVALTPTLAALRFVPPARTLALPAENAWATFVALPAPVSAAISPASAGTLSYTDTQGLRTSVEWPAGVVAVSATLLLTPTLVPDSGGKRSTGHAFELALSPAISLTAPLTVTFRYSDSDLRSIVVGDRKLLVALVSNGSWDFVALTCRIPPLDQQNNTYKQAVCRPGTYALVGPTFQVRVPIVAKL